MSKLKKEIVERLAKKTGKKEATIRKDISIMKSSFPSCTSNAVAQIYAKQHGTSVMQKLTKEDKECLPNIKVEENAVKVKKKQVKKKEKIIKLVDYSCSDYFINEHIKELNKAFTKGCYTATNILARKVIENLIINILRKKFPSSGTNSQQNKELYYDTSKRRFKDFSVILKNLFDKRNDFDMDAKDIIERLYPKAKNIKDTLNSSTHSLYHIIKTQKEITDLDIESIIELIKRLESDLGMR